MDCLPLKEDEDWELFLLKLGPSGTPATLPPRVLEIARFVVMKCDGLPLGISVMARLMNGKNDIHWWRHALNKLYIFEMGEELKEEVLTSGFLNEKRRLEEIFDEGHVIVDKLMDHSLLMDELECMVW
ncbi:putative disease resistance protein [Glycine max]|nr:putative disease resistance protein [Glycine max]